MINAESKEQENVVIYVRRFYPEVLFTSTQGGVKMSMVRALLLKRMGYLAGCPDLIFFEARQGFHGLTIEMKKPTQSGRPPQRRATSKKTNQEIWQQDLIDRGYKSEFCYGFYHAKKVIDAYFTREGGKSDRIY